MKWSEMSVFHKIVSVIGCLCGVAYMVIAICFLAGILPSLYEIPGAQVLWGVFWLSLGILNWEKSRVVALLDYAVASLAFVIALLECFI